MNTYFEAKNLPDGGWCVIKVMEQDGERKESVRTQSPMNESWARRLAKTLNARHEARKMRQTQ